MTHDELLAIIEKAELGWYYDWMKDALRAVVEFHKPDSEHLDGTFCDECVIDYPCPTIQAIEKAYE
jgi:hypothetical protein